jgi:hypothetical protein
LTVVFLLRRAIEDAALKHGRHVSGNDRATPLGLLERFIQNSLATDE